MVPALAAYNLYWAGRWALGRAGTDINAATSAYSTEDAVAYLERIHVGYRRLAGVHNFHGNIAEIGPGGHAGVALLLRADGCDRVDLIDRFVIRSDPAQQAAIYAALSRRHDLDRFRLGESWSGHSLAGIFWHEGRPAEEYFRRAAATSPGEFDFILSHTVLQHLYDPLAAITDMITCLRSGGKLVHRIDLRDQGFFSQSHHELTWLSMPTWLWPYLTRHVGGPNRVLAHRYRTLLDGYAQAGVIDYSLLVTRLVAVGELPEPQQLAAIDASLRRRSVEFVEGKRREFVAEFSNVDALDLSIAGLILIVEKR
jgi:SAM-dependent methyltransferase